MLRLSSHSYILLLLLLTFVILVLCADTYNRNDFPKGFVFGAGSSAYQVEGAANEDGRSRSVWDTFAHQGTVGGANGDIAVGEYHKYKEDVQLMVQTGLEAYRFSISWSRLIPNGRGTVNPKGLQYYNNLINELVNHGIEPHVTLYHYDHPQVLEDEYGGWTDRKMVEDFTAYADVCFREFGDRVSHWTSVNEPNIFMLGGYDQGHVPPQRCSPPFGTCSTGNSTVEPYLAAHHIILAHGSASKLYKTKYLNKQNGSIGISLFDFALLPLTNSPKDIIASQRAKDFWFGWFVNPLLYGDYPQVMKQIVGPRLPVFTSQESEMIKGSLDFIGLIHYFISFVTDNSESLKSDTRDYMADMAITLISVVDLFQDIPTQHAHSASIKRLLSSQNNATPEWPVAPWGMQATLDYFKQHYGNPPIYIHENGQRIPRNTTLEDSARIDYLQAYIGGLLDAVRNGSNTKGYFVWSFLDVFELLDGYKSSFGLYYVDLDDPVLKRYPKLSARWYSQFLKGKQVTTRTDTTIKLGNYNSSYLSQESRVIEV